MDQTLKKLLEVNDFNVEYFPFLDEVKITKCAYLRDLKYFNIVLSFPNLIDYRIYDEFSKMMERLPQYHIEFVLENTPSIEIVKTYYKYFIEKLYRGMLLKQILEVTIDEDDKSYFITVNSDIINDQLSLIISQLNDLAKKVGLQKKFVVINLGVNESDFERIVENEQTKTQEKSKTIVNNTPVFTKQENKSFFTQPYKKVDIKDINDDDIRIEVSGIVFDVNVRVNKNGNSTYNFYLTDNDRAIMIRAREDKTFSKEFLDSIVENTRICVRGQMDSDQWNKEPYFRPHKIVILDPLPSKEDDYPRKRVELHLHTKMSAMDGVATAEDYVNQALKWGHKAIAITDHGVVQAFPDAQNAAAGKPIKIIYGMEGYVVHNKLKSAYNELHLPLDNQVYIVFDLETTGLSSRYDKIIEVGFVKIQNGKIIDVLQSFVNPLEHLSETISNLTHITDDMLIGAPTIDQLLPRLLEFIGGGVLVAHNGVFDIGFLNQALISNGQSRLPNPYIDTLPLARLLYPSLKRFNLGAVCRHLDIVYDSDVAHRADYDAKVLAQVFEEMLKKLEEQQIFYIDQINTLENPYLYKQEHPYHMTFLVKDDLGLRNLFKLVSTSHIDTFNAYPLIIKEKINENREGLLVGSACFNGEIFEIASTRSERELREAMKFYDYIEIQPLDNYQYLIDTKKVLSKERLIQILKGIVDAATKENKLIVATGDCHYLNEEDKIFRDVYVVAKAVGDRPHPLKAPNSMFSPKQHFRTTREMIDGISYVGDIKLQEKFVIDNTNYIADLISDKIVPIKKETFSPKLKYVDADKEITNMCHNKAHLLYGENLPEIVSERMEKELNSIISNKYSVIYYLAYRLVKKSNEDGYLVGSRGSVGSSFVASLCGITEVNPLAPHYLCPKCHHSEFFTDGSVKSGFDLETKKCPICGEDMHGNGQNIPFETFLGLAGDKCPDIDLNFSRDNQASAHEYTKVLCGENNVFRAGTISTVAEKTAFGFARNYYETHNVEKVRDADLRRLAKGCKDVKRTTGQHPAGIVVVPDEYDIYDFTPIQYPADAIDSTWKTTHFNFKSMHDELLKLDILGHLDPMAIRMLKDLTGVDPETIPMNDPLVLGLFTGLDTLNLKSEDCLNRIGSSGVPEFGTSFVKGVLEKAHPTKFSDLVQISGLTHGTNVWNENAEDLIADGTCTLTDVIGCRDDIMTELVRYGLDKRTAFSIMEFVRKGNPSKLPKVWEQYVSILKENNVPDWYIDSCTKIKYMFPKAHAVAYVVMALRVAWFKIHYPLEYYAAYFSVRCEKFDIETMIKGHEAIKDRVKEITNEMNSKGKDVSATVEDLFETMELALEMTARGYKFSNIDLEKSDAINFKVDHETNSLIPPFNVIDGLGIAVAKSIVAGRADGPFTSKEELMAKTQINKTQIKVLEKLGCLDSLNEQNQLTFELF